MCTSEGRHLTGPVSHVPMRGESVMAMKSKHVDGMASWMGTGDMNHEPLDKGTFNRRPLQHAGEYTNKSA